MQDYEKSEAKLRLFGDVCAGKARFLIGSSDTMGAGALANRAARGPQRRGRRRRSSITCAIGAVVIKLSRLKMHAVVPAVGELTEQGSPTFEAARSILSQLLKAETADREERSAAYQLKAARSPNYYDLAGFDSA